MCVCGIRFQEISNFSLYLSPEALSIFLFFYLTSFFLRKFICASICDWDGKINECLFIYIIYLFDHVFYYIFLVVCYQASDKTQTSGWDISELREQEIKADNKTIVHLKSAWMPSQHGAGWHDMTWHDTRQLKWKWALWFDDTFIHKCNQMYYLYYLHRHCSSNR